MWFGVGKWVIELLVAVVRWWKMAVCGSKTVVWQFDLAVSWLGMMVGLLVFAVLGVYFDGWRLWFLRFGGWKWGFAWCNIRNVRWLSGGKCYGMAESMLSKQGFINLNIRFFEIESMF